MVKDLGQFPSLDPTTGKLRPKHTPLSPDGASKESLEKVESKVDLSQGIIWAQDSEPTPIWLATVAALGKIPLTPDFFIPDEADLQAALETVVSENPELVDTVADLVLSKEGILLSEDPTEASDVHFTFADDDGESVYPTSTRRDGLPSNENIESYRARGVLVADTGEGGITFTDENGNPSWLSIGVDGMPDLRAKWAMANDRHEYRGTEEPYVYPGNFIRWTETSSNGTVIEEWDLVNT